MNIQIFEIIIKLFLIYSPSFVFSETTYCYTTITGSYKSCESGTWTFFKENNSIIKKYPDKIEITNKKVNVFQNKALENISSTSSVKSLHLNLADVELHIEPSAFSNLAALENIEINSASVLLDTDIFYGLNNLKYLKIQLANKTASYLNDLLDQHLNLHKLEFVNHQDVDVCDFTRQNTSLNIFELQYTSTYMSTLTRQSFYCLKNLQQLTIQKSNLALMSHGSFNGLKKLKKVSLISNYKLTHISSNVFNVRNLEIINLSDNSIDKIDNGSFIIENGKLALLNLSYNSLKIIEEGMFKNIKCNVIDLTQNEIVAIVDGAFNLSRINIIYLFDNYLFTFNQLKWNLHDNTIVYYQYKNSDTAFSTDKNLTNKFSNSNDNMCYLSEYFFFQICTITGMKLKLVNELFDNWRPSTLEIVDNSIESIEENSFQNLSIKYLMINSEAKNFTLFPLSFNGLKKLEVLILNIRQIQIQSYIFDCLTSLRSLEIFADKSSNIPLCKLLKNLKYLHNLMLSHHDKVNICDKKLCTSSFNLSSLHYEYGKFKNLQQFVFSCLKQLEYLTVTKSKLETIEPSAFDGLDNIKYLRLSSNQIKSIDYKVFMNLNLSLLDLSYNLLTHIKNNTFYGVKTKTLDISNNRIIQIDDVAFDYMNLDHIYYHNNIGFIDDTRHWYINNSRPEANCDIYNSYKICIDNKSLLYIDEFVTMSYDTRKYWNLNLDMLPSDKLELNNKGISSINKYAFKNSYIKSYLNTLIIHENFKSEFIIYPESFDGLTKLENLILDVGPIQLKENSFDCLISLNYLKIEIKKNPKLPSEYINNVLKTVPSIRVLEIINSDSINICNNPKSNKNLLPITALYYTGGLTNNLPLNSLQCLRNLEKFSISETQLTTIEAGVFNSMDTLKYIYLAFNKLTRISTGIFDSLNNLIKLELNHNKIIGIDSKSLMKFSENNLQLVNLSYNEFSIIKKDTFEGFKCSQLDLSHNKISHIEDNAFKDTNIHDIFLFNNAIIDVKIKSWKIPLFTFVHTKTPSYFISFCSGKRTRVCDHSGLCESRCIDFNSSPPGLG